MILEQLLNRFRRDGLLDEQMERMTYTVLMRDRPINGKVETLIRGMLEEQRNAGNLPRMRNTVVLQLIVAVRVGSE